LGGGLAGHWRAAVLLGRKSKGAASSGAGRVGGAVGLPGGGEVVVLPIWVFSRSLWAF
jgi:hypothetical protein